MFLGNREREIGSGASGAVVGYDFDGRGAQISYCLPGSKQPETVSQVAGEGAPIGICGCMGKRRKKAWRGGRLFP